MTIRGIFFDAGGVFYRRPEPKDKWVAGLLRERGFAGELGAQDRLYVQELRARAVTGQLSPDEYWGQVLLLHGVTSAEQRRDLLASIDDYSNRVWPMAGGREALAGLKRRGFILGVITDTVYPVEQKMGWLDRVGISEFIDVMACSTVLGVHKPDPAIYLDALQQAQLTPAEAAFVGHDTAELAGARRAGMATVAVHNDAAAQADYYARSLVDLLEIPIFQVSHT